MAMETPVLLGDGSPMVLHLDDPHAQDRRTVSGLLFQCLKYGKYDFKQTSHNNTLVLQVPSEKV